MKRWQVFILMMMFALAIVLFCTVAFVSRTLFTAPSSVNIAQQMTTTAQPIATRRPTATSTAASPTITPTPSATNTPVPTPTNTRVVQDTATPTPSNTPTPLPTPTNTRVVPYGGGGTSYSSTPTPSSQYPFHITQGPLAYDTNNHILVIYLRIMNGGVPQAGYKLVGTHSPTGRQLESGVSCPDLCKASGVEAIYDENGNEVKFQVQKGNLVFEAPTYDTGTWSLMLVDSHGQQASEIFQLELNSEQKQWFYYEFSN